MQIQKEEVKRDIDNIIGPVKTAPADKIVSIMKNKSTNPKTKKKLTQYRLSVPKEFADDIDLNEKDFEALFQSKNEGDMQNPKYVVTAKIRRKDDTK